MILIVCFASMAVADDFKTIDGKEYKHAKVKRVDLPFAPQVTASVVINVHTDCVADEVSVHSS